MVAEVVVGGDQDSAALVDELLQTARHLVEETAIAVIAGVSQEHKQTAAGSFRQFGPAAQRLEARAMQDKAKGVRLDEER
jgi:hypothetical protein